MHLTLKRTAARGVQRRDPEFRKAETDIRRLVMGAQGYAFHGPRHWVDIQSWEADLLRGCLVTDRRAVRRDVRARMRPRTVGDRIIEFLAAQREALEDADHLADPNDELACGESYGASRVLGDLAEEFGLPTD